jgi:tRNA threonylcarbamoyladenosine biosynthesis protein TsaB
MIVLGFDTATPATAVGLRLADGVTTLQAYDDPGVDERPGHATRLLAQASGLLSEAGLGWRAVERVAVGVGPGTFTGLRIGVATARGIAQSLAVELVGVSSLRALTYTAGANTIGEAIGVLGAIDARRGEVFVAAYDGEIERTAPQAIAPSGLAELLQRLRAGSAIERWMAVGDGAVRYRDAFHAARVIVPDDHSALHHIQAQAICALGARLPARARDGDAPVVPDYRRAPDAEIALESAAR